MVAHLKILIHCAISFSFSLATCILELVRFVQEIAQLVARYGAIGRGQLTEWEQRYEICPWYVAGTDVANQPAGYGTTPAWHLLSAVFLLFITMGETPKGSYFISKLSYWCVIFGPTAGVWYTGALQMQLASGILSTSSTGIGDVRLGFARYIAALALLAIGFSNIILGMLFGSAIRAWRGQVSGGGGGGGGGPSASQKCRDAFEVLDAVLATMTASTAIGPFYGLRAACKKCVGDRLLWSGLTSCTGVCDNWADRARLALWRRRIGRSDIR